MRLLFIKTFSGTINQARSYHHHSFRNNFYKCHTLPTEYNRLKDSTTTKHLGYKMTNNQPKVLIIGAGAAGIAAACRLYQEGVTDVTVLEAENRTGGRIHSVEFGGGVVDLGAQWCHGETDNVVFEMVKDLGVLADSFNDYHDNTYYESSGKTVERHVSDELLGIALRIFGNEEEMIECGRPYGEYFIERYNKAVQEQFASNETHLKIAREMLDWFHRFILCLDASATWFDITAAGSLHYKECEGNLLLNWKKSGFKTIIDILLKNSKFPATEKVLLNKQVNKITWNKPNSVAIECTDGTNYIGSHVIVTVSLGVLQENHQKLFTPKLPHYKQNAIEGWSLGTVGKILLKFRSRWWPADCKGFSLIWTQEDREALIKEFPHGPSENGRSWLEDVFGFYVIDSNPDVLLGWMVGKHVKEYELLSDEIVVEGCLYLLKKFLGGFYNVQKPESVLRSRWYQNPNFRGSYSFRGVEAEKRGVSPLDLARPLVNSEGKEVVLFAGEATHAYYYSTVHGAIETGFREADRILSTIKRTKQNIYTVAIVGAGISGLAAAKELVDSGCENIVILEAQDRPGGRIHTIHDDGVDLELGAQWIHGKRNPLYDLAKKHDLIAGEKSDEARGVYVRDDGLVIDEDLVEKVDFVVGKILYECEGFVDAVDYPDSVGKYLEKHFCDYLQNSLENESVKQQMMELYDWHVRFQVIDNSCTDFKSVSAKEWGRYEIYNGQDHINLKNGYKAILEVLLGKLPKHCLRLKTPVQQIKCDNFVTLQSGSEKILAKHVILTPSLGVLRSLIFDIHPPLPIDMCQSIKHMGFYGIGKIYLIYDNKWWNTKGIQLLWRKDGAILNEDEAWMRHITGFDEIWNHPTALLGWIGGDGVKEMEGLSEEEIGVHCTRLLQRFLCNYYCDIKIPQPKKVIRTTWLSNSYVKGSYCNTSSECDELNVGIDNLKKPIFLGGEPKILLAGEAVHKTHFSTTHGAFESGQQQARVLLDYIKKENKLCKL